MTQSRPAGETPIVEIVTTFEHRQQATDTAEQLVELGLIACAQIDAPMMSVYRWQGKVTTANETRCTFKTLPSSSLAAQAKLAELHPYEVPQMLVRTVAASADYYAWVNDCVTGLDQ